MKVQVCSWKSCSWHFSKYIVDRLQDDKKRYKLKDVIIEDHPCMGGCKMAPNISIDGEVIGYMKPVDASNVVLDKINWTTSKKKNKKKKWWY